MIPKIRIWDKVNNCWLGDLVHRPFLSENGQKVLLVKTKQYFAEHGQDLAVGPKTYDVKEVVLDDRYVIVKSTGIFDSQSESVELYQDDVVLLDDQHKMLVCYGRHLIDFVGKTYASVGFFLKNLETREIHGLYPYGRYRVLGNIHENPDLVEGGI